MLQFNHVGKEVAISIDKNPIETDAGRLIMMVDGGVVIDKDYNKLPGLSDEELLQYYLDSYINPKLDEIAGEAPTEPEDELPEWLQNARRLLSSCLYSNGHVVLS